MPNRFWASWIIAFLLAVPLAHAQTLAPVGTEGTFDVATWNIEWFGSASSGPSDDARQLDNVRDVILESDIDLWAVQEIADRDDFDTLLAALGSAWSGTLATQSGAQRIGFIYRKEVVQAGNIQHILTSFSDDFAGRPPLQLDATVTIGGATRTISFIVLHMKAFDDSRSYNKRVEAAKRLKNRIDFLMAKDAVVVLGDLNDQLTSSIRFGLTSPYQPFVDDTEDYRFLTLELEESGTGTYCRNNSCSSTGSFLDHILITDELFGQFVEGSAGTLTAVTDRFSSYGATTSDHLPVYARFDLALASSNEPTSAPRRLALTAYPMPARHTVTLGIDAPHTAPVTVDVVDLLGRRVHTASFAAGSTDARAYRLGVSDLAAGMYLVTVRAGSQTVTRPFVKID